jgi:hypothetical protein
MIEPGSAPLAPAPAPAKTNPWIIVSVVLVVLCCGCFGAIGLLIAFVPDVLHELGLTSWLPLLAALA